MPLTKGLIDRLPSEAANVKNLYELFQPTGTGSIHYLASKQKGDWVRRRCTLEPDELNVCFKKFPYPVERLNGRVDHDFLHHTSTIAIVGYAGNQPITLTGTWTGAQDMTNATIEVTGKDIPLNNQVVRALPENVRKLAESFHATGKGSFRAVIQRKKGSLEYFNTFEIHFAECQAQWDKFPLLLESVCGDLTVHPKEQGVEQYEFKNFEGTHNGGKVFVCGKTMPRVDGASDGLLIVNITGQDLSLDMDLKNALTRSDYPKLGTTWDNFAPAGRFSFQAHVEKTADQHDMDIGVDVAGCAIKPSFFPIDLLDVTGKIRYHDKKIEITNFTARHNSSLFSIQRGKVDLLELDRFYVTLEDIRGNHVLLDDGLLQALPEKLRKTAQGIHLQDQTVDMQAKTVVISHTDPHNANERDVYWNGQLWFQDANLQAGIDFKNVTGSMACEGRCRGEHMLGLTGNIFVNDATVLGQPFHDAWTHFAIGKETPDVMLFTIYAPIFGGKITGAGRVELTSTEHYQMDLAASEIALERFAAYNLGPKHPMAGIAAGQVHLEGQGADGGSNLKGQGTIDVPYSPKTKLMDLPLLLDLLKFLGLGLPDRTAFEEAHARFAIDGNRLTVSKLELLGNAISLYGKGDVNMATKDLKLDMYSSWGRAEQLLPSVFRNVPSAISKQLLKIEVRGKIGGHDGDLQFSKVPVPSVVEPLLNWGKNSRI